MDLVAPPVRFLVHLRFSLEQGDAIADTLRTYLDYTEDECAAFVRGWWVSYQQGKSREYIEQNGKNMHRRALLLTLEDGLSGESILPTVRDLEIEFVAQSDALIDQFLRTLPFRALIPIMVFLFPAYLLLFFGPILENLIAAMSAGH